MTTTVEVLGFARGPDWLPWAVQYFFLIGVSCAAFFVSLPGLVWRRPAWRELSRYALLAALVSGLTAPVALMADLHQPGRFLNFYLHPNFGSWMAWGSFFIPLYIGGLLLYAWLCLRPALARLAADGGRLAPVYRQLAYGGHDSPGAIRLAALAAGLGAVLLLLYTGMETMIVSARVLWHTPLLPLIFAASAGVGGLGMTLLVAALAGRRDLAPPLNRWLLRCLAASLILIALWAVFAVSGSAPQSAEALAALAGARVWTMTGLWFIATSLFSLWLSAARPRALWAPALLALHGAWLLRWIVFIGGQGIPKMGSTWYAYSLGIGPDGLLGIVGSLGLALFLYVVLTALVPWDARAEAWGEKHGI